MSWLEHHLHLAWALRSGIDLVAYTVQILPGPVLLLGMGNGRVLDHLAHVFPGKQVLAFDERLKTFPELTPSPDTLFLGDYRKTLSRALGSYRGQAVAAVLTLRKDGIGSDVGDLDQIVAALTALVRPEGLLLSDREIDDAAWIEVMIPDDQCASDIRLYARRPMECPRPQPPRPDTTRLDAYIRRMHSQVICLGYAAGLLRDLDGPVFELGLANGRTYDHLVRLFPLRKVYVHDTSGDTICPRKPPASHLILGDARRTLAGHSRIGGPAALIHYDLGSSDPVERSQLAREMSLPVYNALLPGGIVVGSTHLDHPGFKEVRLPIGPDGHKYYILAKN